MIRRRWKRILPAVAVLGLAGYLVMPGCHRDARRLSLLPRINRMIGLRFDPSFFYDRGVTARELARNQVALWQSAGVNAIFFRVYDPTYGASYRTELALNQETDYGKQDLLGHVLEEAHERDIKVYAWLPVLNHRGAWEAKPEWRALRQNGEAYRTESLTHPLCPRQPGVRREPSCEIHSPVPAAMHITR